MAINGLLLHFSGIKKKVKVQARSKMNAISPMSFLHRKNVINIICHVLLTLVIASIKIQEKNLFLSSQGHTV